jgi:cytochrome P450
MSLLLLFAGAGTTESTVVVAAYGTIKHPNRAGTIKHPNKAGEIKHPNRAGAIRSDFQGDS